MTWTLIIPTSIQHLGGYLLVFAIGLVFLDVPGKGVPWDRVAAVFAVIGGFGVGGSAGGWLGRLFSTSKDSVMTNGDKFTANAVGVGAAGAIFGLLLLWAFARMRGKGISTKTKVKSLIVVAVLALVGTLVAAVPGLHSWSNSAVYTIGTAAINVVS